MIEQARDNALAAQHQIVVADPPFAVIACPGAGKTRVTVDRHLTNPVPVRMGRAITSFTRVAAAEVYRRCSAANRLDLTDHPHFIGTLDTFVWLHLVRPFLPADRIWRRLESWRDAPASLTSFVCNRRPFQLADVDFDYDPRSGTWSAHPRGAALRTSLPDGWCRQGLRTRGKLETAGYLTGAELRAHACRNLATYPAELGRLLKAKYAELVVDEAQDCSAADFHILDRLYEAGLPLILMADPDQAIYGFRGSRSDAMTTFTVRLGHRHLTHNWRSTTTICTVAATLRADPTRRLPDIAVAHHYDAAHPVLIYTAEDRDAVTADFLTYAAQLGIGAGDCLVLSYAHSTLPKALAGPTKPPSASAAALAWAVGIITECPAATPRTRSLARAILTRTVLRWWYSDSDTLTPAETLAAHEIDTCDFERLLHQIATAMPSLDQPMSTWTSTARDTLTQHQPSPNATRSKARLICRSSDATRTARTIAGLPLPATAGARPRLNTVHQVKGDEAEAVLLLTRPAARTDRTLTAWLTGTNIDPETAEALRVLYVAVTRARRLLGIAVPAIRREQVRVHLEQHGVQTELR